MKRTTKIRNAVRAYLEDYGYRCDQFVANVDGVFFNLQVGLDADDNFRCYFNSPTARHDWAVPDRWPDDGENPPMLAKMREAINQLKEAYSDNVSAAEVYRQSKKLADQVNSRLPRYAIYQCPARPTDDPNRVEVLGMTWTPEHAHQLQKFVADLIAEDRLAARHQVASGLVKLEQL